MCSSFLGTKLAAVVPAQAPRHAHIFKLIRECRRFVGQSSATAFPPPLRGRNREGGTTSTESVYCTGRTNNRSGVLASGVRANEYVRAQCHPPPCPSPAGGEGTVWHAPSQLARCPCGKPRLCGYEPQVHLP